MGYIYHLIFATVFGLIIGLLAMRKKRNAWLWGSIFGGGSLLLFLIGLSMPLKEAKPGEYIFGGPEIYVLAPLFWLAGVAVLAGLPFLCPKCKGKLTKQQRKSRSCPTCGTI